MRCVMRKRALCFDVLLSLLVMMLPACAGEADHAPTTGCPPEEPGPTRYPAVAGRFYPNDPAQLSLVVDQFLAAARIPDLDGRVRVMIVPHAGYVYSGAVAAHAFKAIEGQSYKTVVLIGNSHNEGYHGASVYPSGQFRTPLGDVPIDSEFARKLMDASPLITYRGSPHILEHSLEVEVPFLQKALGEFKLVPILLGDRDTALSRAVGTALAEVADSDTLVVASSDLSHYPSYDDARFSDLKVVDAIVSGDARNLERTISQIEQMKIPDLATAMCGQGAVKAVMFYAQDVGADDIEFLKYANSGDVSGTRKGVVGYAAIVFLSDEPAVKKLPPAEKPDDHMLTESEQEELLRLARNTVETYIRTGKIPAYQNKTPLFSEPLGAFVTLKEHGQLRGCIGRFEPDRPLYEVVQQMAIAAATQDGRFRPVSESELADLEYEISVLSPLRKAGSWKEIELGKHGVQIQRGLRRGVFLPQVATETGWDLETFMGNLCAHKAGLSYDAWKDPKTDIYLFTAEVFHE